MPPTVPLHPEPLDVLRLRYPAAIADVLDVIAIVAGTSPRPSGSPTHVFDTVDGIRLIVSREQLPDGRVGVHISASFHDTAPVVRLTGAVRGDVIAVVIAAWRAIAQSDATPELLGLSTGGILHFYLW